MRVLQVIHGYPMRYNAGSEVYTQTLSRALAARHEVHVFTREENAFAPDHALHVEHDEGDPRIKLHVVNMARQRDRYRHAGVDRHFANVLDQIRPDIVHIGHLNHLSTSLVFEAARREVPVVFTLHDYWLMCPRGQFIQMFPEDPQASWGLCEKQRDAACAQRCYARYFSGDPAADAEDAAWWTSWIQRRMAHVREVASRVDLFISPSHHLLGRFRDDFGIPATKLHYLDYGFDRTRLIGRSRRSGEPFTFGYIGTHIPAKGIQDLITAFGRLGGDARLRIWGRHRGQDSEALRVLATALPGNGTRRVEWLPEYHNERIVPEVFNQVDAIVVPSIWLENSPLVIHEAQQARVPVITADAGGMAEYVAHEVNGLLFAHRDAADLSRQMQRLLDDPALADRLGARGYLADPAGEVPDIQAHVTEVEALYQEVLARREKCHVKPAHGPWRITFDTNPDDCNLHCLMCEQHSLLHPDRGNGEKKGRRRMPMDLIRHTLEELQGNGLREVIPSTMGEPLLYAHFEEILALCRQHGVRLNLTTNGTFPRLGAKAWAERIVPVGSDVKISINGATAATQERIMVGTHWEQVLANIQQFVAVRDRHAANGGNRCRITLQVTFMEVNVHELPDVVRLAARVGADRVKGHHVWPHFPALQEQSLRRNPGAVARWNGVVAACREVARVHRLPNGGEVILDNFFPLDGAAADDIAPGGRCPFLGREVWVNADGRFDPCCAPDAQRRSLGSFGTLHERGLLAIWSGPAYRELLATWRNHLLCLGCNMRRPVEET